MKEIKSQDWNTFCQQMNQFEHGATVDIQWIDRATNQERSIAESAELEEITFGAHNGCSDQIVVRASGQRETRHEILEPIRIFLRESGDGGSYNAMAVESEEGTTILRFHPVIHPEWLQKVGVEAR
ncbi:MAG TPA: DUF5335 family protein [Candidatus Angelobacter sp.]|nr:DUF5335 family protein [Candidatus Angelobacter sp.]